jgi:hypothetical protein
MAGEMGIERPQKILTGEGFEPISLQAGAFALKLDNVVWR